MYVSVLVHVLSCVAAVGSVVKQGKSILVDACNGQCYHRDAKEAKEQS